MQTKTIVYRNFQFGFAIAFPAWWKSYIAADRRITYSRSRKEVFLTFLFRYEGKVYEPVVTIVISKLKKKAWKQYFKDSPVIFLGHSNGFTFGYLLPEELPDAFLRPDKQDYDYVRYGRQIRKMKKLVSQVPEVLQSFHSIKPMNLSLRCQCRCK